MTLSEDVLNIDDEAVDPSYALNSSMRPLSTTFEFSEEWVSHLLREDSVITLFLSSNILILDGHMLLSLLE